MVERISWNISRAPSTCTMQFQCPPERNNIYVHKNTVNSMHIVSYFNLLLWSLKTWTGTYITKPMTPTHFSLYATDKDLPICCSHVVSAAASGLESGYPDLCTLTEYWHTDGNAKRMYELNIFTPSKSTLSLPPFSSICSKTQVVCTFHS